jgi:hypothetical protein
MINCIKYQAQTLTTNAVDDTGKGKSKVPNVATKADSGSRSIAPLIPNLGTRCQLYTGVGGVGGVPVIHSRLGECQRPSDRIGEKYK